MRYGIFSDVHSNLQALEAVIEAYNKESIDSYLCLGDIVGYAASPAESLSKTARLADVVVAGNHDFGCVGLFDINTFNPLAREAMLWTESRLDSNQKKYLQSLKITHQDKDLTLVHGSLFEPEQFHYLLDNNLAKSSFALQNTQTCFIGHSHIAGTFILDENKRINYTQDNSIELAPGRKYIINVGSVGQPRNGDPRACFCVYDTDEKYVNIKRIKYDIKEAQRMIIAAGLPQYLAERLSLGR